MKVRDVSDAMLEERLLEAQGYVLVLFTSPFVIACDHFKPEYEALSELIEGDIEFLRIVSDEHPAMVEFLKIDAVPTTLLFKDLDEIRRFEGPYSKEALKERLKDAMLTGK